MVKSTLIKLVQFYRGVISPWFAPACRFHPTCSAYCEDAIAKKGPFKGIVLTIGRLLRCHPFHTGGYDPVR